MIENNFDRINSAYEVAGVIEAFGDHADFEKRGLHLDDKVIVWPSDDNRHDGYT